MTPAPLLKVETWLLEDVKPYHKNPNHPKG